MTAAIRWMCGGLGAILLVMAGSSPSLASEVSFDRDVLPVLTRFGCNSGRCHGASAGRGGFHLSLFGSRPADDFQAITEHLEGRRIHLTQPDQSLLLLKPLGLVDHGGDVRFAAGDEAAVVLLNWIRDGARRGPQTTAHALHVEVSPAVMTLRSDSQGKWEAHGTIQVLAQWDAHDDSRSQDVTRWSLITADDPTRVDLQPDGRVTVTHPGQYVLLVRYPGHVRPVILTVPRVDIPPGRLAPGAAQGEMDPDGRAIAYAPSGPSDSVDHSIDQRCRMLRVPQAGLVDDSTFLRRITLDLAGRLPTLDEQSAWARNADAAKQTAWIDQLLHSADCDEFWTYRLIRMLGLPGAGNAEAMRTCRTWIAEQVRQRRPMDELVRGLLLAEGRPETNGPASFYLVGADARLQAEYFTESLLGIRLRCANCHDHPLDQWTQDDYHGLAAVFARVERRPEIRFGTQGTVIHPQTGRPAVPRIPGFRDLAAHEDGRQALLTWMLDPNEPRFARALVNRVWYQLMGRGLVNPPDDLRATNPASHPELWHGLTQRFVDSGYDLKSLIREICQSRAYARQTDTSDRLALDLYASRQRRIPEPAVLVDAICDVTGVPEPWSAQDPGTRAISLADPGMLSPALKALGQCLNTDDCSQATEDEVTVDLPVALNLIHGSWLNDKLSSPSGRIEGWMQRAVSDEAIVHEAWRRSVCRAPLDQELQFWLEQLRMAQTPATRRDVTEDLIWSLVTSDEFLTIR